MAPELAACGRSRSWFLVRCPWCRRTALVALLLLPLAVQAAVVSGAGGVDEDGRARLDKGSLRVGETALAWNQLAWYHRGRTDAPLQPQAVVTAAGERYTGSATGWDGTTLRFAADPGASAQLELPRRELAMLELRPGAVAALPETLPALLRRDAPAVPGELQRLAREGVAISGPLGAFTFGHDQATAYAWRAAEPTGGDQVLLVGGARLHAPGAIEGDRVVVDHPRLGRLALPLDAIQEIRRARAGVRWLGGSAEVHRHRGALGEVPAPRPLDVHDPRAGLAVVSDTVLGWPAAAGTVVIHAVAGDEPVGLVLAVDKQTAGKLVLAPGEARTWHVAVGDGARLLLAVKGISPRPGRLELHAPHLVEGR